MAITWTSSMSPGGMLAEHFEGPSWDRWRACLKAANAEALTRKERQLFREVADRAPPKAPVREMWFLIGRRAGKDSVASCIGTVAAVQDYRPRLRPGERASIICLAVDREQARIVQRYIKGYFSENPLLNELVIADTDDGLLLANEVEIIVATNSYRSVRGKTVACAVFDEVCYWRSEESANPDVDTYRAIAPALVTLDAPLIAISTVHRKSGLAYEKWAQHYGQDSDVLVIKAPSRSFNPLLPEATIEAALKSDPEAASAEWLSEWRSDLSDFIDRALVEGLVVRGRREIEPLEHGIYQGFTDPSGGSSDSFTAAVAHRERDGRVILDAVREIRAPFSPAEATARHAAFFKDYKLKSVHGDKYAGHWPSTEFAKHGIRYEGTEISKSDIYRETLPHLTARRVELLDNDRLISQLCSLERRVTRTTGKDLIDHPANQKDDVVNAALGAIWRAATGRRPLVVTQDMMNWASLPATTPYQPGRSMTFAGDGWVRH
jgi:hypothetical protein